MSPTEMTPRKIIHCDCDAFYAAVEMRDDPSLRGRPLAVGGKAEHRGVVATCNYEARRFGIHSAMATAQALKRCPQLLVIPPDMAKYRAASDRIATIYRDYTDLVEPLSLDEAYLDVTGTDRCRGSATLVAAEIRARIRDTVGITASAGVAPNKFLAKIASDWNKPDGLFVIRPDEVDEFVARLPVAKLFGVGPVTAERLQKLGARNCADLRGWPLEQLQQYFGAFGFRLFELCRGIDRRVVDPSRERKSISVETTFVQDLRGIQACRDALLPLVDRLVDRIARAGQGGAIHKLFVKVRFADFSRTTTECLGHAIDRETLLALLETGCRRSPEAVRLLGVGVRLADADDDAQLSLGFSGGPERPDENRIEGG